MERTRHLPDIRTLSPKELSQVVSELGQPAFRAKQLNEWLFEKNVCSFEEMTNLPKAFREQLAEYFVFAVPTEVVKQVSKDGSRKSAPPALLALRARLPRRKWSTRLFT